MIYQQDCYGAGVAEHPSLVDVLFSCRWLESVKRAVRHHGVAKRMDLLVWRFKHSGKYAFGFRVKHPSKGMPDLLQTLELFDGHPDDPAMRSPRMGAIVQRCAPERQQVREAVKEMRSERQARRSQKEDERDERRDFVKTRRRMYGDDDDIARGVEIGVLPWAPVDE